MIRIRNALPPRAVTASESSAMPRRRHALLPALLLALALAGCGTPTVPQAPEAQPPAMVAPLAPSMALPQGAPAAAPARAGMAPPAPTGLPAADRFANAADQPWQVTAETPVSTFGLTGDTASYSLARRVIALGRLPSPAMVRAEEFLNAFDWAYPQPDSARQPIASFVSVHPSPWAPERRLVHIGLRAWQPPIPAERPRLNLVLLVDVSGSMSGQDRLPLLRQGLQMLARQMRAEDRVSLVTYASGVAVVLDGVRGDQQDRIAGALDGLRAGGGTAGGDGLATAYRLAQQNFDRRGVNRVVLATDGDFNLGPSTPAELKDLVTAKRRQGIYLTAIGVGLDNFNDRTLHALTRAGNGTAIYAGSLEDLRRGLVEDFSRNIIPVADDVKVQVEFNPAAVARYRLIGYETRLLRREDFRDDSVDSGELGSGRAVTAIYEIIPVGAPMPPAGRPAPHPLRYAPAPAAPVAAPPIAQSDELGFLRVAWKLPGQTRSQETARPIAAAEIHASFDAAPEEARFAAAVAGFAQLLRGSTEIGSWSFLQAEAIAAGARGPDPEGRRAEFVQLIRLAAQLRPPPPR